MLAGPNQKKKKLNEISDGGMMIDDSKEASKLKKRLEELEKKHASALEWIENASQFMTTPQATQHFKI